MAKRPLFATYRQGENRVTASIIAVFERLDMGTLELLLGSVAEEASLTLVEFGVVKPEGKGTVPDAFISGSFRYLFEVKLRADEVRSSQIRGHLKLLERSQGQNKRLFVLTPDAGPPALLGEFANQAVSWLSFARLNEAIEDLLGTSAETLSERERYLLRELQALFAQEGLLSRADTVIVPAGRAYDEYQRLNAYLCQPNRSFRNGLKRMGFYRRGAIKREFPVILHQRDEVLETMEEVQRLRKQAKPFDREIASVVEKVLTEESRPLGGLNQIFLLTGLDDPETFVLDEEIDHAGLGLGSAWVQNQRYVLFDVIQKGPTTTAELAEMGGLA